MPNYFIPNSSPIMRNSLDCLYGPLCRDKSSTPQLLNKMFCSSARLRYIIGNPQVSNAFIPHTNLITILYPQSREILPIKKRVILFVVSVLSALPPSSCRVEKFPIPCSSFTFHIAQSSQTRHAILRTVTTRYTPFPPHIRRGCFQYDLLTKTVPTRNRVLNEHLAQTAIHPTIWNYADLPVTKNLHLAQERHMERTHVTESTPFFTAHLVFLPTFRKFL